MITISILITVVSGKAATRRCLEALTPQVRLADAEIIVPYDAWTSEIGDIKAEFPSVQFHRITDLGIAASSNIPSHQHRLYDRRRAVGLGLARGRVIAMTEDHAVPAPDWVEQILRLHGQQPYEVIGGTIDNIVDHPLHWALYYCDHGRYGSPQEPSDAEYVSDVNVTYKREVLERNRDLWCTAYHETTLHWALRDQGVVLRIDPALRVYKHRPPIETWHAVQERVEWGRIFAETRVAAIRTSQRICYAVLTPLLPVLLQFRIFRHMLRQRRTAGQILTALPLTIVLLASWSLGEFLGYVQGEPRQVRGMTRGGGRELCSGVPNSR